jgi:subtilisin family serine protease
MEEREYIVILKKGVDYDAFWNEIENESEDDNFVPTRRVDIINERPGSLRSCHYSLTDEEAERLKNDDRIYDVEIPPDQREDIEIGLHAVQSGTWRKTISTQNYDYNHGLLRGAFGADPWSGSNSVTTDFPYTLTGKGVDIVIQDSGVTPYHPEWLDDDGNNRYKTIDWYEASGLSGTQSNLHDRDVNGHGSHCAGIAAGKIYGWAKNAHIYSQKLRGLESAFAGDTSGIAISNSFDAIKLWHRNKPIDPNTGFKRPTVVNMSWGYGANIINDNPATSGIYRGTAWTNSSSGFTTNTEQYQSAGIVDPSGIPKTRRVNVRVSSVDADLEELIDEGVHVCIAAGNTYYYVASNGDSDWNNIANFNGPAYYYHRGASPYSTNAFIVGNIDTKYQNNLESKSPSSCSGPGVDIYAPGTSIISVSSKDRNGDCELGALPSVFVGNYITDSSYKIMRLSGTSMATPNVAGMIATILEANPGMTPAQMKTFIHNNATPNLLYNGVSDDWDDKQSIQGGPNRIFKTPFTSSKVFSLSNLKVS